MPTNTAQKAAPAKHTPGPWKVAGSCHVRQSADGKFFHTAHITLADDYAENPCIAEIDHRGRYSTEESKAHSPSQEQAANARLIAAAPDLLAALEGMLEAFPPPKIRAENGFAGNLAHSIARTAIAKAKGE